jgi:hypothetical protein
MNDLQKKPSAIDMGIRRGYFNSVLKNEKSMYTYNLTLLLFSDYYLSNGNQSLSQERRCQISGMINCRNDFKIEYS